MEEYIIISDDTFESTQPQKASDFMKKADLIFRHIKNAYDLGESDSMYSDLYQEYIRDDNATKKICGINYSLNKTQIYR